jgi:hypothetical protein
MTSDSTIKEIDAYVTDFAGVLKQYRRNPIQNTLMMNRRTYGGVRITLIFQEQLGLTSVEGVKDVVTPPKFDKIGLIGLLWGSLHTPVSSIDVITNLYKKVVGQPYADSDEVHTLYEVICASSIPIRQDAIKQLRKTFLCSSIVKILHKPPLFSSLRQLFELNAQQCQISPCPSSIDHDAKLMPQLWSLLAEKDAPSSQDEIERLIAEGSDDNAYLLRTIALGTCREIAHPVQALVDWLFGGLCPGTWSNTATYEIIKHKDERQIIQKWNMQLHVEEYSIPRLEVEWAICVTFDRRCCPKAVTCTLNDIKGPMHEIRDTMGPREEILRAQLSIGWHRTVLGDIKALFFHPDPATFTKQKYVSFVECPIQSESQNPQFDLLQHYVERGCTEPDPVAYVQSERVPPCFAGTVIAISRQPLSVIGSYFEHLPQFPQGLWHHTTETLQVSYAGLKTTIVRQGRSSRDVEGVTIDTLPWALSLTLSLRGDPESINFCLRPGDQPNVFFVEPVDQTVLPPPHPLQSAAPQPISPPANTWIPVPFKGIGYNNRLLNMHPDDDPIVPLLSLFDIHFSRPLRIAHPAKLRKWLSTTEHPCASAMRACIISFSPIPVAAVTDFLQHLHPTREGEQWTLKEVQSSVVVEREEHALEICRTICCTCRYEYIDVFGTKQQREITMCTCEVKTTCDMRGRPCKSQISCSQMTDADSSEPPEHVKSRMHREWNSQLAWTISAMLNDPMQMPQPMSSLLSMKPIKVLKDGWALLDKSDLTGHTFVTTLLPLPKELLQNASRHMQFQEQLTQLIQRRNAWHAFMTQLGLPGDFRCCGLKNMNTFVHSLKQCRDEVGACLQLLDGTIASEAPPASKETGGTPNRDICHFSREEVEKKVTHWESLFRNLDIPWPAGARFDETTLCEKWSQYEQERDITLKLMVLDGAGSTSLRAAIHQHLERIGHAAAWTTVGQEWRHQPEEFDVNLLDHGDMDITMHGRAARVDHPPAETELAGIRWNALFRLRNGYLAEVTMSVQEIEAPSLIPSHVGQFLTHVNSTWTRTSHNSMLIPLLPISMQSDPCEQYSCNQYLLRFPTESICNINDMLPYFRDIIMHSLSSKDIIACIKKVEASLLQSYIADPSHLPLAEALSTHHSHSAEVTVGDDRQFTVSHRMIFTCFGISQVGNKGSFKLLKTIPWGIDMSINAMGDVRSVNVINFSEVMTEPLAKEFRTILGTEISFEQISPSTTFASEGDK